MKIRFKPTSVVLAMLCAMYFITYMDRVNIGTAASGIQHDLHLSNTELGLVFLGLRLALFAFSGRRRLGRGPFRRAADLVLVRPDLGRGHHPDRFCR